MHMDSASSNSQQNKKVKFVQMFHGNKLIQCNDPTMSQQLHKDCWLLRDTMYYSLEVKGQNQWQNRLSESFVE